MWQMSQEISWFKGRWTKREAEGQNALFDLLWCGGEDLFLWKSEVGGVRGGADMSVGGCHGPLV